MGQMYAFRKTEDYFMCFRVDNESHFYDHLNQNLMEAGLTKSSENVNIYPI